MLAFLIVLLVLAVLCATLFVLYLFAVRPGKKRPQAAHYMGYVYAHRGLHNEERPENSLAAFEAACRAGYGIELDVQLSRDGVPVVFHDGTLARVCGIEAPVSDYTAEELGALSLCGKEGHAVPTLAAVLELVNGRVPLMVEIKGTSKENTWAVCRAAAELLDAYNGGYCMESFNPYAVRWFLENRPHVVRGQLSSCFMKDEKNRTPVGLLMQSLATNFLTKPDFISFDRRYNRLFSFRLATKFWHGYATAWTVQSRAQELACRADFNTVIFENYLPE